MTSGLILLMSEFEVEMEICDFEMKIIFIQIFIVKFGIDIPEADHCSEVQRNITNTGLAYSAEP